jgi:glutamine phosphoribosylpyrophosphate amidotransferase
MRGKPIDLKYAVTNAIQAHYGRRLNKKDWQSNVKMAHRQSRTTIAIKRSQGLEYQYALTDIHRAIIKKAMMTPDQAYQKNKVTKKLGLAWVMCG